MTFNFVELFVNDKEPLPPLIVSHITRSVTSEHPTIRRICLTLINRFLIILKNRSFQSDSGMKPRKVFLKASDFATPELTQNYLSSGLDNLSLFP